MNGKKKLLKPVIKVMDRTLSNPSLRRRATRYAKAFIEHYSNHGTEVIESSKKHFPGPWEFMLDTPKLEKTASKTAYISGWFVSFDSAKPQMRVVYPSKKSVPIKSDIKRFDVAETLSKRLKKEVNLSCGFGKTIPVDEDGTYTIEAKLQNTWQKVCSFSLRYDPDFIVSDIFNGNLAYNYASHLNLISNKQQYFYEEASRGNFQRDKEDARLIAFYLPQFHPFKENNEWWGKGFTEWSNVASATPKYVGHEQPKLPKDLGYYDLRVDENIKDQVEMAKKYGINAFAFYYYWFSGHRLMEKPLDTFLKHKEWDFGFMICWANENWTRRWDGRNQDVLIAQENNPEDALNFIKDVEYILLDPRYVRVDGKPVLSVYRADELDDTKKYAKVWREYFRKKHNLELHLVAVQGFSDENPQSFGFDRGLEFAPLTISSRLKKDIPRYDIQGKVLDVEFTGAMYDYRRIALDYHKLLPKVSDNYRSVMPRWDNDARRKGSGGVFADANPDLYGNWLSALIAQANLKKQGDDNLVFINAWNEWAEGAFLEPDTMYGHSYLRRTAEVMARQSNNPENVKEFPMYGIKRSENVDTAVVVHLYYTDLWKTFTKYLNRLDPKEYDLFVTLPKKSEHFKTKILEFNENAHITIVPNRGRDVLPFIHLSRRLKEVGYNKFLKIHSKKSTHRKDGDVWINDLLKKLLPANRIGAEQIMTALDREDTGIVGPFGHYISLDAYFGSNEEKTFKMLSESLGEKVADQIIKSPDEAGFFAGTMFWGRFDALETILDNFYQPSDFEHEAAQTDGTFAHAAERAFTIVPWSLGKTIYTTDGGKVMTMTGKAPEDTNYGFAQNKKQEDERLGR